MNLPLNQINKRKFSIWLDTSGASEIGNTGIGNIGFGERPVTYDLIYDLPIPLQSESGMFNVSLKSFNLSMTQDDDILVPMFSVLEVSLANVSSAYNAVITNSSPNALGYTPNLLANESVYNLCPIGSVNIWNDNSLQLREEPVDPNTNAIGTNEAYDVYNISVNPFSVTINDPGTQLHIVLSTIRSIFKDDEDGITSIPFVRDLNDTLDNDSPMNFPYRMLLQFEEV